MQKDIYFFWKDKREEKDKHLIFLTSGCWKCWRFYIYIIYFAAMCWKSSPSSQLIEWEVSLLKWKAEIFKITSYSFFVSKLGVGTCKELEISVT